MSCDSPETLFNDSNNSAILKCFFTTGADLLSRIIASYCDISEASLDINASSGSPSVTIFKISLAWVTSLYIDKSSAERAFGSSSIKLSIAIVIACLSLA